jgi:ankyrin repeat protein
LDFCLTDEKVNHDADDYLLLVTTAFADPIHDAAENGDLAGVQAELSKGMDVGDEDVSGLTPLNYATRLVHKEIVELLTARSSHSSSYGPLANQWYWF